VARRLAREGGVDAEVKTTPAAGADEAPHLGRCDPGLVGLPGGDDATLDFQ